MSQKNVWTTPANGFNQTMKLCSSQAGGLREPLQGSDVRGDGLRGASVLLQLNHEILQYLVGIKLLILDLLNRQVWILEPTSSSPPSLERAGLCV